MGFDALAIFGCIYVVCLAVMTQSAIKNESSTFDSKTENLAVSFIEAPVFPFERSANLLKIELNRALYEGPTIPPRYEPDKSCSLFDGKPRPSQIPGLYENDFLWIFQPKRAEALRLKRLKVKNERTQDPCPLILTP